jgi:hypothetical protein
MQINLLHHFNIKIQKSLTINKEFLKTYNSKYIRKVISLDIAFFYKKSSNIIEKYHETISDCKKLNSLFIPRNYSTNNEIISTEKHLILDYFAAGERKNFNLVIKVPAGTSSLGWEAVDAVPYEN